MDFGRIVVWSIGVFIASIYFSQNRLFWTAYVGPILAFISFILSMIIMPKTSKGSHSIENEEKPNQHFVSRPSRNYEDDKEWDDEEEEERRHDKEDEEEFMMHYEEDD